MFWTALLLCCQKRPGQRCCGSRNHNCPVRLFFPIRIENGNRNKPSSCSLCKICSRTYVASGLFPHGAVQYGRPSVHRLVLFDMATPYMALASNINNSRDATWKLEKYCMQILPVHMLGARLQANIELNFRRGVRLCCVSTPFNREL